MEYKKLTDNEKIFLDLANNQELRPNLLARLEKLGLLASFREAENGAN